MLTWLAAVGIAVLYVLMFRRTRAHTLAVLGWGVAGATVFLLTAW